MTSQILVPGHSAAGGGTPTLHKLGPLARGSPGALEALDAVHSLS